MPVAADITDLPSLFSSITGNIGTTLVPAVLVAIGAVALVGLTIWGAKFGVRAIKAFFGLFAR